MTAYLVQLDIIVTSRAFHSQLVPVQQVNIVSSFKFSF